MMTPRVGAMSSGLRLSTLAAFLAGALLVAATPERAEAQFYPWGSWGNPGPWKQKQRRARRPAPRYVEPVDEKPTKALPKPSGPLVLVVSLNRQTVTVYDDGKQIAKSPISSGTRSNPTPTGVFSILEKNRTHHSNLYNSAPMPFMQRLTNSGIALHAGDLPGYPASHGCIRLPYSFARSLFDITDVGARVIVSNDDLTPTEFNSPALIAPLPSDNMAGAGASTMTAAASGNGSGVIVGRDAAERASPHSTTRNMAAAARAAERNRLAAAVSEAGNAKAAADAQEKAATAAVQDAKETVKKARAEEARLAQEVRKTAKTADTAASRFKSYTEKLAKIDISKIDGAALEKHSAEEVAEETKMLDAADAAAAAKRALDGQVAKTKQAVADAGALENARKIAAEDAKQAETVVADAQKALTAAETLEARKDYPVSIFISGKTGRLIAKLGFIEVMDVPVTIADPDRPLGTHVLTATHLTDGGKDLRWNSVSLKPSMDSGGYASRKKRRHQDEEYVPTAGYDIDPAVALERIQIPEETAERLAELMKPGSSFIISDYGLSRETSARTEFVVEPWRSRSDTSETRYY